MPLVPPWLAAPAAALLLSAAPASVPDLTGTYRLVGWNPGADQSGPPSYSGTLTLRGAGRMYEVHWATRDTATDGVGLLKLVNGVPVLAVGYRTGTGASVAAYDVLVAGTRLSLRGEWVGPGLGREHAERLSSAPAPPGGAP